MKLIDIIDDNYQKEMESNKWLSSKFKKIKDLSIDRRGKIGEEYVYNLFKNDDGTIYNEDIIDTSATYDIIINNKKVEIKTATIGVNNTFQHENFFDTCDYYILLDISYNGIYICCYSKNSEKDIYSIASYHSRHTTGAKKLTVSLSQYKKLISKNYAISSDDDINIYNFLKSKII